MNYVAYGELDQSGTSPAEGARLWLKVLKIGTDDWVAYPDPEALYGWAPASRRFAFVAGRDAPQLRIGQYSGATLPGSIDAGVPVSDFRWLDTDHYLFVARRNWEQGAEGDSFDLILGSVDGSSTVLTSAPGSIAYDFSN